MLCIIMVNTLPCVAIKMEVKHFMHVFEACTCKFHNRTMLVFLNSGTQGLN